jgi:hypothetical protein
MKTYWKLSENGWEYEGRISIMSETLPTVKEMEDGNYMMKVDDVVIYFDEEIVQDGTPQNDEVRE